MLSFQRLDVYQCSVDMVSLVVEVDEQLPRGTSKISDQLNRASMSVTLNIAEGYGKSTLKDKRKFYTIVRGSAMECAAVFDVLERHRLIEQDVYDEFMELADRAVAMLTKMCGD